MGEIGIQLRDYLYDLRYIDLLMIQRGYDRRHRYVWAATRWQTYNLMSAQVGTKALQEAGIFNITDLIRFPWEEQRKGFDDGDIAELERQLLLINGNKGGEG